MAKLIDATFQLCLFTITRWDTLACYIACLIKHCSPCREIHCQIHISVYEAKNVQLRRFLFRFYFVETLFLYPFWRSSLQAIIMKIDDVFLNRIKFVRLRYSNHCIAESRGYVVTPMDDPPIITEFAKNRISVSKSKAEKLFSFRNT